MRSSTLEPASSTSDSATSATTSALRMIACRDPPARLRLASRIAFDRSRPAVCSAGASPQMMLVSAEIASANSSTDMLSAISDSSGIVSGGTSARIAGRPA